jgi:hypothetical protein
MRTPLPPVAHLVWRCAVVCCALCSQYSLFVSFISNCVAVHYGFQVKHNSTLSSSVSFSSVNYFSALTVVCLATFIVINQINTKSSAVCIRPCHLFKFKVTSEIMNRLRFGRTPWKGDQPDAKPLLHRTARHRKTKTKLPCLQRDSRPRS